jgi:hypothetical protein
MVLARESNLDLRKKLLRRLLWKVPFVVALVTFALWWEVRQQAENVRNGPIRVDSRRAPVWDGAWEGEAIYPEQGKVVERFFFQTDGDKLSGTATYLSAEHAIEEGRWAGAEVSFSIRLPVAGGGERIIYYRGNAGTDHVKLRVQDDGDHAPVEFTLGRGDK